MRRSNVFGFFCGIHPFQDGNGRVGRLIMLKECLKYNFASIIITDDIKMPLLVSTYGKNIFELSDESIKVTIPYNWQHKFEELVDNQVDKLVDKLSKTEKIVFDAIKDNPRLSQPELAIRCNVGKTTIQNVIIKLKELNLIERVGSNKTGYWEIKE